MQMEVSDFLLFLRKAQEKECEEQLKKQWTLMLPFMSLGMLKYASFESYVEQCSGRNIDMRPAEVIIAEIEELHGRNKKGGELDEYI